jgi:tripartite-type tricarboxylate transporter receptor subunit TctC
MFKRRDFGRLVVLTALAAALTMSPAMAQSWPTRPISLVVPFAVGSGSDLLARVLGPRLAELLGQPVVVENISGAGGSTGSSRVAQSPPEGYHVLLGSVERSPSTSRSTRSRPTMPPSIFLRSVLLPSNRWC